MTDTTATSSEVHHTGFEPAGHAAHPSDRHYIGIALFLAVLTALETSTYYLDWFDNTTVLLIFLVPVMAVKFGMVAWFFMHLKVDSRLFSKLFLTGVVAAVVIYMIVLLTFDEFF
jgi:caa(3)-type oxidase subunit IV